MSYEDERARHAQAMVVRRMDTIDNLAMAAFKGLTIINGGAIVALFALLAQGSDSAFVANLNVELTIWGAAAFAGGLFAILGANVLGYFAQQDIHWYEQEVLEQRFQMVEGGPVTCEPDGKKVDRANLLLILGGIGAALSLAAFFVGCGLTIAAALAAV